MDFHYYYIIQDIIGVLMAIVGLRMLTLSIRMIVSGKKTKSAVLISIKYALITAAGVNFLISTFGLKPWIISIILVLLSIIITPKNNVDNIKVKNS